MHDHPRQLLLAPAQAPVDEMVEVHRLSATAAYAHLFSTPFPLDDARRTWAGPHDRVWLARRGEQLVGFAAVRGDELAGLYVLPGEAGRGTGSALLEAAGDVRRLWVLEDNHAGRAWYERRGWRPTDEHKEAYGVRDVLYVTGD